MKNTAICHGQGKFKYEVGIAVMDLYFPHLISCQISDNHVYSGTLAKINLFLPEEIIIADPSLGEKSSKVSLHNMIHNRFERINLMEISRIHFNSSSGSELIQTFCTNDSAITMQIVKEK